jgi:hypothetical protein
MSLRDKLASLFRSREAAAQRDQSSAAAAAFAPANPLEEALVKAAADPAARQAFTALLLTSDVYVATPDAPAHAETRTLQTDEHISIVNIVADNGANVPALFTSEIRLAECFGPGTGFIALNGRTLMEILAGSSAWLNPTAAYGVFWTADDLSAMLGRPVSRTLTKKTSVMLGEPAQRPEQLIADLQQTFSSDSRIEEAWLALAHWPDADEWGWYLDVRSDTPANEIVPELQPIFAASDMMGKPIDIIVQRRGLDAGTGLRLKPLTSH